MAKGQSTFRQLGKIDGRKYYQVKGVDGIVSQSINQGMSNRVKNDAAYANTRLNNAEFGGAGSTAGAITRALTQKWRYLLVPFATGKIAKDVRAIMMQDSTSDWGKRGLTGTEWQTILAEKVSSYSKNPISDYSDFRAVATFNSNTGLSVVGLSENALQNEKLESLGFMGVRVCSLTVELNASSFDSATGKYKPASTRIVQADVTDVDFGESSNVTATDANIKVTSQSDNKLYGGIIVMLPYKEIHGIRYVMQEHCSFKMVAAA